MTSPARVSTPGIELLHGHDEPPAVPAKHRASARHERLRLGIRRTAVAVGVALSIVVAALTTQAAALWTAASAPLQAPPVSGAEIASQLASEQARAAALDQQVSDLTAQSDQLATALQAAQGQLTTDAATAAGLRAKLKAAQGRLASLQKALKAAAVAAARAARQPATAPAATPARPPDAGGGDD